MDGLSDAGSIPARSTPERETAMQSLFLSKSGNRTASEECAEMTQKCNNFHN